ACAGAPIRSAPRSTPASRRGSASSSHGTRTGPARWITSSACSRTSMNCPAPLNDAERLCTNSKERHADRRFADDHAIVAGIARYKDMPVAVLGHQKGRDTKQKIFRNFGYARPEGYRKALRVLQFAQKFSLPVIVFIDTPAAYPGIESEERGVAEAIALNLREMMMIEVPLIVIVCGEG